MEFIIHSLKHGDYIVLIDDEDAERVMKYKWYVTYNNKTDKVTAISRSQHKPCRATIPLHDFIMGEKYIDHGNMNVLDNRKSNLRKCTIQQNACNREKPKHNTSGYKGVYWEKGLKKWRSAIRLNNKKIHIGCYEIKIEAAKAYNKKAKELFGEFARLNEI